MSAPPLRCAKHVASLAGWACFDCQRMLCNDCVATKRMHTVELLVCRLCQGRAEVMRRHRAEGSFWEALKDVWSYPFARASLGTLVGMAVLLGLFKGTLAFFVWGIARFELVWAVAPSATLVWIYTLGIELALLGSVIRQTAQGATHYEPPELGHLGRDVLRPALFGLLGNGWLLFPVGKLLAASGGWVAQDPLHWIFTGLLAAYAPWVLLMTAAGASFVQVMNPLYVIGSALRVWDEARWVLLLALVLVVPGVLLQLVANQLWARIPLLGVVLGEMVALYVPLVLARALGLLLRVRGDSLGYGIEADYLEPVLGGVHPRHVIE